MARSSVNQYVRMTMPMASRGEAEISGLVWKLTPREQQLLEILLIRGPLWSTVNDLIEMLWPDPDDQPETAASIIKVTVYSLREKSVRIATGRVRKRYRIAQPGDVARHKRQPVAAGRVKGGLRYEVNPPEFLLGEPFRRAQSARSRSRVQSARPSSSRDGGDGNSSTGTTYEPDT